MSKEDWVFPEAEGVCIDEKRGRWSDAAFFEEGDPPSQWHQAEPAPHFNDPKVWKRWLKYLEESPDAAETLLVVAKSRARAKIEEQSSNHRRRSNLEVPELDDPIPPRSVRKLVKYLPKIEGLSEKDVFIESKQEVDDQGNRIFSMYQDYTPIVAEFESACYELGFVRPFDWGEWQKDAQEYYVHPELLEQADLVTCVKLITLHIRKERFSSGHLGQMIISGHLAAVLRRMKQLAGTKSSTRAAIERQ